MRKTVLLILASVALTGATSAKDVYGDAVFWFRGGRDANGDGFVNTGSSNKEFFNELKAANPDDPTQTCTAQGYPDGIMFETERVVFPCQPNVTQDLQCIRFKQEMKFVENLDGSITTNFWAGQLNLPVGNLITGEQYACVFRLRLDGGCLPDRTSDLLAFGYSNPIGWLLRFEGKDSNNTRYLSNYVKSSTGWRFEKTKMLVTTNEWMDLAVSVAKREDGQTGVRFVLARPNLPVMFNLMTSPASQSFNSYTNRGAKGAWRLAAQASSPSTETEWTALTNSNYRYSSYPFRGSIQQLAFWNRPLSDDEIYEAFGMPRPNLMQVGVGNGGSDEFGAARTGATQAFDASAQTLRDRTSVFAPNDEWTLTFTVNAQEAGMAQLLTFASTTNSAACQVRATVNGTLLGGKLVKAGGEAVWYVPGAAMRTGANTVTLKRVDAGTGTVQMDFVKLGGSWQAGKIDSSNLELVSEMSMCSPFFSSADLGWKHWVAPQTTYHNGMSEGTPSNQVYHVWLDDVAARFCSSKFVTTYKRIDRTTRPTRGDEEINIFVNGVLKRHLPLSETPLGSFVPVELNFGPCDLNTGWNELRFAASPYNSCYWQRDYFRFELGKMHDGTLLIVR